MKKRDIGTEILEGLEEIQEYKRDKIKLKTTRLPASSGPKAIRAKLALTQSAFAGMLGVSLRTLQDWEQGRRQPQGPAIALLRIAEQHPNVFVELK